MDRHTTALVACDINAEDGTAHISKACISRQADQSGSIRTEPVHSGPAQISVTRIAKTTRTESA